MEIISILNFKFKILSEILKINFKYIGNFYEFIYDPSTSSILKVTLNTTYKIQNTKRGCYGA